MSATGQAGSAPAWPVSQAGAEHPEYIGGFALFGKANGTTC